MLHISTLGVPLRVFFFNYYFFYVLDKTPYGKRRRSLDLSAVHVFPFCGHRRFFNRLYTDGRSGRFQASAVKARALKHNLECAFSHMF